MPSSSRSIGRDAQKTEHSPSTSSSSFVWSPSSLSATRRRPVVAACALSRPLDPPSAPVTADADPELLEVLEMCDDAELENVWGLLTGEFSFLKRERKLEHPLLFSSHLNSAPFQKKTLL